MKKMFLTLAIVLVGSMGYATTLEVKNDVLNLDELKKVPLIITTSCGTSHVFENSEVFTDDQVFDMIDFFDTIDCNLGEMIF